MSGVVIPLLIVAVLAGAAYGRDRDARPLARRLWRAIYWGTAIVLVGAGAYVLLS